MFEQLMERILHGLRCEILLVYLDDDSTDPLLERLAVFLKLPECGLKLKPKMCHLLK